MKFYVTAGHKRYELAKPETMTFDEGLDIVRFSGGMNPIEVVDRFSSMHPAAVLALLVVSMRRKVPTITPDDPFLKELKFVEVVNSLESVAEEGDEVPPAGPPVGGDDSGDENGSSEPLSTPSAIRSPDSETSPESTGTRAGSNPNSEG